MAFDPAKRITAEEALRHPYFQETPAMKVMLRRQANLIRSQRKCQYLRILIVVCFNPEFSLSFLVQSSSTCISSIFYFFLYALLRKLCMNIGKTYLVHVICRDVFVEKLVGHSLIYDDFSSVHVCVL